MAKASVDLIRSTKIFEHLTEGILCFSLKDDRVMYMNCAAEAILGITEVEWNQIHVNQLLPEHDQLKGIQNEQLETVAKFNRKSNISLKVKYVDNDSNNFIIITDSVKTKSDTYKVLFENNPIAIYQSNLNGEFQNANPTLEKLFGFSKDELKGCNLNEFVIEEDRYLLQDKLETINKGKASHFYYHIKKRDGNIFRVQDKVIPIMKNGKVEGFFGIVVNFDTIEAAKKALQESEVRYKLLINELPDPICLHDGKEIIFINKLGLQVLGAKSKDDIIGKSLFNSIDSEYREQTVERIQALYKGTKFDELIPLKLKRLNDEVVEVEIKSLPFVHGNHTVIMSIFRDVTERNIARNLLLNSQRRYQSLFEHNPDGICSVDLSGNIITANPAMAEILNYTYNEMINRDFIEFVHKVDINGVKEHLQKAMQGNYEITECKMINRDKELLDIKLVAFPIFVNEQIIGAYTIAKDITEQRRSEELLRRSDKLKLVGQLAASVAHEIRNPLTSLKGFLQLMEKGVYDKEYFSIMSSEFNRIELILSELLVLAKPQSIKFTSVKIKDLIEHVITLFESQTNMYNIRINRKYENPDIKVSCEENQLKQVFVNVIKNAIEVMPNGGVIDINCKNQDADKVNISITDQGPGIPPKQLKKLGEPFYTTKEKGTGLGLMISSKIVKDHKGSIMFESKENQGTKVNITLPQ